MQTKNPPVLKILTIVGARPNFVKAAPLHRALQRHPDIESKIVHTGQHHDFQMSGIFFEELNLPEPDHFLGVSGGSHTEQTARIMLAFEKVIKLEQPDLIIVLGDVNSSLACALASVQAGVPLAHVEAGLRSGDKSMPEEINRMLIDAISDNLFVTEQSAVTNLGKENVPDNRIHHVGNIMIDSIRFCQEEIDKKDILSKLAISEGSYTLVTMHRPVNVDDVTGLLRLLETLEALAGFKSVLFVMHPRTMQNIARLGLNDRLRALPGVTMLQPLGYIEFLSLVRHACLVVTDSGGIQEETTFLGVPCLTLRNSTERPVTLEIGTNQLIADFDAQKVASAVDKILQGNAKKGTVPELWDGETAERIVTILREKYINS
jgi:UDP-N-acetylglucosamine 2-epimerase (non-hydrolysing)